MKTLALSLCLLLCPAPLFPGGLRSSTAQDTASAKSGLDELFQPSVWELSPGDAESRLADLTPRWLDKEQKRLIITRQPYSNREHTLEIFGGKVSLQEVQLKFDRQKLGEIYISVWNKGDAGKNVVESKFDEIVAAARSGMDGAFGAKGTDAKRDNKTAVRAERVIWTSPVTNAILEHSSTGNGSRFEGEFIRIRMKPAGATATAERAARKDLVANVTKKEDGSVLIPNVPMVDQGQKGYCVVASCQRVFEYMGIQCDQHELAQAAGTEASGGTTSDGMSKALDKLEGKYKVSFRTIIEERLRTWDDIDKFTADYNRAARKLKKEPIPAGRVIKDITRADADVLREVKSKGPAFTKFQKAVRDSIDKGVPLLWSLALGIYPENGEETPQEGGYHMRLIIGYNTEKNLLIFSDSWGANHAEKTIPMADAFAATTGVYAMVPTR